MRRTSRKAAVGAVKWVVALVLAAASLTAVGVVAAGAASKSGDKHSSKPAVSTKTTKSSKASKASSSLQCAPGLGTGAPGVTSKAINVAAISSLTGPISADFKALVPGAQAYFDMVDAKGGVDGRKINLAYNLNTQGTLSRFETLTHTAIDQDHAFATIISTYWFQPTAFVSTCTPTYGYNVSGNWANEPNLFAAGGSTQTYDTGGSSVAYLAKKVKAKSVAFLAYNVSSSADACTADAFNLVKAGVKVPYTDVKLTPINPDLTPDVEHIRADNVGLIVSCMTVDGNVALAREVKEYGLKTKMLFFTVVNQTVLQKYQNLLDGAYYTTSGTVPLNANKKFPGTYPGVNLYLSTMNKYEPAYTGDDVAMQGWESAALLVAGIKAAGKDLTQANVVKATNQLTDFTANGLYIPMNWTITHSKVTKPYCSAYVEAKGDQLEPVYGIGKQVFVCFDGTVKHPTPVATRPGTPGPAVH